MVNVAAVRQVTLQLGRIGQNIRMQLRLWSTHPAAGCAGGGERALSGLTGRACGGLLERTGAAGAAGAAPSNPPLPGREGGLLGAGGTTGALGGLGFRWPLRMAVSSSNREVMCDSDLANAVE